MSKVVEAEEIDILARTIYGEARGEYVHIEGGIASLIAVGNVVMNRLSTKSWFGQTIGEVCHKRWQFSCWNENDPNHQILMKQVIPDPVFSLCHEVATKVVQSEWPDLTRGSDHYHASTLSPFPSWVQGEQPRVRFARHIFYRLNKGD